MSPGRSIPVRYLTLLGAAGAVACGDSHPTSPIAPLALTPRESTALLSAVDDIHTRIEPALGDSPSVATLHAALARMSAAVVVGDRANVERAVKESENALATLGAQSSGGSVEQELDAVRLLVAQATSLLEAPSGARGETP